MTQSSKTERARYIEGVWYVPIEDYNALLTEAEDALREIADPSCGLSGDSERGFQSIDTSAPRRIAEGALRRIAGQRLAMCDGCSRVTWTEDEVGQTCLMPQPDDTFCRGVLRSLR